LRSTTGEFTDLFLPPVEDGGLVRSGCGPGWSWATEDLRRQKPPPISRAFLRRLRVYQLKRQQLPSRCRGGGEVLAVQPQHAARDEVEKIYDTTDFINCPTPGGDQFLRPDAVGAGWC